MYYAFNEAENMSGLDKVFSIAAGIINAETGTVKNKADKKDGGSYSSIAKRSSALVAVFPLLASRTVSRETALAVSKYIEQVACNMLVIGLQSANISNAKDGVEYLRQFHQNLGVGGNDVDTVVKTMQAWIDAYNSGKAMTESSVSSNMYNNTSDDGYFDDILESDRDFEINGNDLRRIMEAMAALDTIQVYDTQLNPRSINDYIVKESDNGTYHVSIGRYDSLNEASNNNKKKEQSSRERYNNMPKSSRDRVDKEVQKAINAEKARNGSTLGRDAYFDKAVRDEEGRLARSRADRDESDKQRDRARQNRLNRQADAEHDERIRREKEDRKNAEKEREDEISARRGSGRNVSILKDQDIKKMNDAVPSILTVRFYQSETASVATEFFIGVKAKMIPVTTTEVLRRIMNDNKDGKKFNNFMRMITGEISKGEFFLGLSRAKEDAKSCRVKGAYGDTWNLLKNRADVARKQVKSGQHNDYSAITTVLISQADAEELYREENFDITDPKNALHFMESYNLMGFIIADDATETLKVLLDDDTKEFDEYSYTMLEREQKDGTYKKLINLMAASK